MKSVTAWLFFLLATAMPFLPSCATSGKSSGTDGNSATLGNASTPDANFLRTDFPALAKWLDERFDVNYRHMTPQLIFDQVPLNSIYYEISNLPTNAAPFNFSHSNISRRELLQRIAQHWNLKMSLVKDASGSPTAVRVEG